MSFQQSIKTVAKTKQFRIMLHIGFWAFYLSLPIFQYYAYTTFSTNWIILITVINLIYVAYYYLFAYYVIPKFFNAKKAHVFIFYSLALYVSFFYLCIAIERYAVAHYTFNEADMGFLGQAVKRQVYYLPEFLQLIIVTAIPLSLKFMRRFYKLQDEKTNLEKLNTDLELNFLKSQLNPHFLFNSLNNIYSLSLQKNDKAPEMIIKLSDLMRYMLYECNIEKSDLEKEVAFMKDYVDLEKIRHGEHVEIDFVIDGDLKNKKIPPLLLIPFVENAFKHGVNAQLGKSWVKFNLTTQHDALKFTSENNKPINGSAVNTTSGGIGIENAKKRLELLYPQSHKLQVGEEQNIYKVYLEIEKL